VAEGWSFLVGMLALLAVAGCGSSSGSDDAAAPTEVTAEVDAAADVHSDGLPEVTELTPDGPLADVAPELVDVPDIADAAGEGADAAGDTPDVTPDLGGAKPIPGHWVQLSTAQLGEHVLKSLWGFPDGNILAVGEAGLVAAKVQDAFAVAYQNPSLNILNGVWGSSTSDVWTVGMYGLIYHYDGGSWTMPKYCNTVDDCSFSGQCLLAKCVDNACSYSPTGAAGCCGADHLVNHFDSGAETTSFLFEDLYAGTPDGGINWQVASVQSKGEARFKTAPNTLYFGQPWKQCPDDPGLTCPDFNNGKTVGGTATSPVIDLPPTAETAELTFQLFIDVEASPAADKLFVRVLNSGKWEEAWSKTALSGNYQKQFVPVKVDLSKYIGKSIKFQFYFDSVNPTNNALEGVYVDDLLVTSTCSVAGALAGKFPTLWSVWGAAEDDVFAVGSEGNVLHYDGTSWQKQAGGETYDVLGVGGAGGNDVMLVGKKGLALHSKGAGWETEQTPTGSDLAKVAGTSPDRYVAVGANGTLLVYQSGTWSVANAPPVPVLSDVIGFTDTEYYVVGGSGALLKYNGSTFQSMPTAGISKNLNGVWGESGQTLTVVGEKLVASGPPGALVIEPMPVETTWNAVTGSGTHRFVAGFYGKVVHHDGQTWTNMATGIESNLLDICAVSPTDVYAVGELGGFIHYDGSAWSKPVVPGNSDTTTYTDCWASGKDNVYVVAVTENGSYVLRFDGKNWKVALSATIANLRHVNGLSGDNVYAVGQWGTIVHYDGKGWGADLIDPYEMESGEKYYVTQLLLGVHAVAEDDVYAVGEQGTIVHYDGQSFKLHSLVDKSLRGVWGLDKANAWAVGVAGYIVHFTGTAWVQEESGTVATLYDVWGDKDGNVFAVGDNGVVLRFIPD
jgi:hypothetical protein